MANRPITPKEKEAWVFAKNAHKGQLRKFINKPYFNAHVQKVNGIVKQYTTDEDLLCAALLHDVAEDCYEDMEVAFSEIKRLFGSRVEGIVRELTSLNDEIEHIYHGSKANYLIDKMINMTDDALIVKLADRLQNISDAFTAAERFRNKYYYETMEIVEQLEAHRTFNKIQQLLLNEIKTKLGNISSIFKIKRFRDI
jgi:(p)ppGpp synthase/HD superfamily hydrolase